MNLSPEQTQVLRHALGLDYGPKVYRNRFVTGPGTSDYPHCEELVVLGLMTRRGPSELTGGDYCYAVSEAGLQALGVEVTQ